MRELQKEELLSVTGGSISQAAAEGGAEGTVTGAGVGATVGCVLLAATFAKFLTDRFTAHGA